ncbi:Zn(II)2Cys6 transcription factor [Penicillium longicatenatum]|uniref:Zn(II)2Cys6 transcription factor n=1 Tax=Penicillium longicatenatum TaxID=1561947 RepID=UPI0025498E04|nr:Zn(II)2Cys6 transcription factor [Penicillium longicatenatum]KAJ5657443.1 Zn(II)2Cys6 transcription factor [Penicillium longicatenatum]
MLKAGVLEEMTEGKIKGNPEHFRKSVRELDSVILDVISELSQPPECQTWEGADVAAVVNLWLMARFLAHAARIKLHHLRSFGDHPVFLDKFCDLSSINSSIMSHLTLAVSPGQFSESNSVFLFTEEESTLICLKAALVLSRTLRTLPWPNPFLYESAGRLSMESAGSMNSIHYPRSLPYMACCGMQGCYVLMMLLRKIRTCLCSNTLSSCRYLLGHTEPATEYQDAERFIEELRNGVKSVRDFMPGNAVFGRVMDMAREAETTYTADFHE